MNPNSQNQTEVENMRDGLGLLLIVMVVLCIPFGVMDYLRGSAEQPITYFIGGVAVLALFVGAWKMGEYAGKNGWN